MSQPPITRRTEGLRVQGRSARVVDAVLKATAEQLGLVGYAALRIEDVALASGVNKTTIYRRWPSKPELVHAVLLENSHRIEVPNTGSLHGDLETLLHALVESLSSPAGRGLTRIIQAERAHPEVDALVRRMRSENTALRRVIFERAIARGEIPAGSDAGLLAELCVAPLVSRVVHAGGEADEHFLRALTEMVVAGAKAGAAAR
ncbi:MAG: TetR/AcrR family transcriptional regulator [Myxococcales bacterium]